MGPSTAIISAHCNTLMSALCLTNSSQKFVPICMIQRGMLDSYFTDSRILMLALLSFHAGVASLIPLLATSQAHIDDAAFEDAIREYQHEGGDAAVEDEVEEYEYPSSKGRELIDDE